MLLGKALTEKGFAVSQPQVMSTERHSMQLFCSSTRTYEYIFTFFRNQEVRSTSLGIEHS